MDDQLDPLQEAFLRCAEDGGGSPFNMNVDLDRDTVVLGSPGLYDGLVATHWTHD